MIDGKIIIILDYLIIYIKQIKYFIILNLKNHKKKIQNSPFNKNLVFNQVNHRILTYRRWLQLDKSIGIELV